MNSWHNLRFASSCWTKPNSDLIGSRDCTGRPGSQALPSSITTEPVGVSKSAKRGAKDVSHCTYASPWRLPYCFFSFNGNGGEVKINCILPRKASAKDPFSSSSDFPTKSCPALVV